MGRLAEVRRLTAYDRGVFDKFERAIARRGWAEATKNREIGHLTLKDTLVHILNVHEAWLVAVAQGRWEVFDDPNRKGAAVRSFADLWAYRRRVRDGEDALLAGLTERRLAGALQAPWMPGRYTLDDAFHQVSYEQAHHLGEIIGALWQADRAPPPMTWIENLPRR